MGSGSDANVSARRGGVMTVRHVVAGRRGGRGCFTGGAGVDQACGLCPGSPSPAQPAFEKVGMNRYPWPGTVAMKRGCR